MKAGYFIALLSLLVAPLLAQGLPEVAPGQVGLSEEALAHLGEAMQAYVEEEKVAGGVVMVARKGRAAYYESFGLRDREVGDPMERDDLFRIHSMTKPITSVAVLMLYEDGLLGLDDPVAKYLPAFADTQVYAESEAGPTTTPLERPITLRDLLMHTSGLTSGQFGNTPVDARYREADPLGAAHSLDELALALAGLPLLHQPGAGWTYSLATDVLARVIEVASGEAFDVFLQHKLFDPLGMNDTGFYVPEEKIHRLTALYESTPEGLRLLDAPATSRYARPPVFPRGNTGLISTAADYARFAQMLLNGGELNGVRLLRTETVRLMTRNHLPPTLIPLQVGPFTFPGQGFGLGVGVQEAESGPGLPGSAGSYWWVGSAHTYFWVDSQEELVGILLTQFQPVGRHPIMQAFQALVYQAVKPSN